MQDSDPAVALFPTPEEIQLWIGYVMQHTIHVEAYLHRLQVGKSDIQRPHDVVGYGNKLEWPAIRGFALQYRRAPGMFDRYVKPALDYHRQQYHHLCWNKFNPSSSTDAMRLGAVDAVCSLLEGRLYQGGCHTYQEIQLIAEGNPIHRVAWMQMMAKEMERMHAPRVAVYTLNPLEIHSSAIAAGVGIETADVISERLQQVINTLKHDHGIVLPTRQTVDGPLVAGE